MGAKDDLMKGYQRRGGLPQRRRVDDDENNIEKGEAEVVGEHKDTVSSGHTETAPAKTEENIEVIQVAEEPKETEAKAETSKAEKEVKSSRQTKTKKSDSKEEKVEQIRIEYYDEKDRNFLRDGCRICGFRKMNEFFLSLVEEDAKLKPEQINVNDENHKVIVAKKPLYGSSSVKATTKQKEMFVEQAKKHVLNNTEYSAYLIHAKRLKTPGWNE